MKVTLYVEGGGDSKDLHVRCREAYRKLLENAGLGGRMPKIVAGGSREKAFDKFQTALKASAGKQLLLVDSESPVEDASDDPDSPAAWAHLQSQDRWTKPRGAANDQAQLMVTSMETWIAAHPKALKEEYGSALRAKALPDQTGLEARSPQEVFTALQKATKGAGHRRSYAKGRRSFQLLALVDPRALEEKLPHFRRLLATLRRL